jgi:hypothetical protein
MLLISLKSERQYREQKRGSKLLQSGRTIDQRHTYNSSPDVIQHVLHFAGVFELRPQPAKLGLFRVHRDDAGDPERLFSPGPGLYRVSSAQDVLDVL